MCSHSPRTRAADGSCGHPWYRHDARPDQAIRTTWGHPIGWFLHRNRRKTPYSVLVGGQMPLMSSVMADHVGRPGRFSRRTLLSAAGAALVSADLAATARAGVLVDHRFDRMRDRNGWGHHWYARHYSLVFDVHRGRGRLHLPAGLKSTAPSQPIPVFLLDHECRDATHELHFQVTHAGLRPGLVLHRRDAFHYLAVTVEHRRLVLASYSRTERQRAGAGTRGGARHRPPRAARGRLRADAQGGPVAGGPPSQHAARGAAAGRCRRNAGCAPGGAGGQETGVIAGQPLRPLGSAVSTHHPHRRHCSSPAPRRRTAARSPSA